MRVPSAGTGDLILEHNVLSALFYLFLARCSFLLSFFVFFWHIFIEVSFSGSHMHGYWGLFRDFFFFLFVLVSLKIALEGVGSIYVLTVHSKGL